LARRLDGTGVTANALHPGVVRTDFGSEDAGAAMRALTPLIRPFMKSPERGAQTSIYLASAPEVATATGGYYVDRRPRRSSARSYDADVAARLWQVSADLVGLAPHADPPGR
jgi:NAD(P)-dependent dehydrogenase (short-subunit alcohol dehydrogenase family)